ncbi:arginine deiminase-related protein [Streptomyces sp. NPDC051907]|uniref:dimethylarginine dimethylaminohydrolase family protein n=1 Tax=Streptomyces sp. NPDC051907 TaxID=3155284 RepID=UPI00343F23D5
MTDTAGTSTAALAPTSEIANPSHLEYPAFLVNAPFSLSAEVPNNVWMEELAEDDREINRSRAMVQFLEVFSVLSAGALVYVLPTPRTTGLQDLVYVANLGIVPTHLPNVRDVIISNFTSEPRRGETQVGVDFFRQMGYEPKVSPFKFEGEADLKHLHDNVYIGGYGQRSQREAYEWMEREYDMRVVKVEMADPHLYHLDCSVFPITEHATLVHTAAYSKSDLAEMEKHTEVIDVPEAAAYSGICNSVRSGKTIVNSSCLADLKAGTDAYQEEKAKLDTLERIAGQQGFEVVLVNIDEYFKSGALLSCMVMHLNRFSYGLALM